MVPMNKIELSAHYCKGCIPVAFVFSVPGKKEQDANRPISGATGVNLSYALEVLNEQAPELFKSQDRYCYRITNAYSKPTYRSKDKITEQGFKEITAEDNVKRVICDLAECEIVVLCGRRAQMLASQIEMAGNYLVIPMWHTSSQALLGKYNNEAGVRALPSANHRARRRAQLWARDLLMQIPKGR